MKSRSIDWHKMGPMVYVRGTKTCKLKIKKLLMDPSLEKTGLESSYSFPVCFPNSRVFAVSNIFEIQTFILSGKLGQKNFWGAKARISSTGATSAILPLSFRKKCMLG